MRLHRGPEARRSGTTSGAHSSRLGVGIGEGGISLRLESGSPSVVRDEEVESLASLVSVGDDLVQGLAVLADELSQQLAPSSQLREALGIVGDLVAQVAQLGPDVGAPRPRARAAVPRARRTARAAGEPRSARSPSASSAPPSPVRASTARAPASRWAVASASRSSSTSSPRSSSASSSGALVDLVELVAQQVDLAGPRRARRHRARRARRRARRRRARRATRARRASTPAEPVERARVARPAPAATGGVLAVQVDEAPASSASSPAVARRPSSTRVTADAGMTRASTTSVVTVDEAAFDRASSAPWRTTPLSARPPTAARARRRAASCPRRSRR